ncbi:hypothetical protein ACFVTJ_13025 [Agrobacterium sp. NPDC058088]|uniref:hypothetical protein n=1 Tax=Agrobacterium sp. NPDC058088 TaxID=3346335 RepID=UPI0036D75F2C
MQFSALALLVTLASPSGWSPSCVTDVSEFDFLRTSPTNFAFGSRNDVSAAYQKLIEVIGDPAHFEKPTLFYVTKDFSHFTKSECSGDKCRGMDILIGEQQCAADPGSNKTACTPIAAVYQSRVYCLLEPSLEDFDAENRFRPFQ